MIPFFLVFAVQMLVASFLGAKCRSWGWSFPAALCLALAVNTAVSVVYFVWSLS